MKFYPDNVQSKRSGFSLTELMVVVAIMVVIGSMAVMNVVGRSPIYRLERARRGMVSDLRAARQSAVSRSIPVRVTFLPAELSYSIWIDANQNGAAETGEVTVKTLRDAGKLTMTVAATTGIFTPLGTWKSSALSGFVRLTSPTVGSSGVIITPSGEVRDVET